MRARGFTLPEVLAAIAIVAVLTALAFPLLQSGAARARSAKCLANLRAIGIGLNGWLGMNL